MTRMTRLPCSESTRRPPRHGFTIIELLVVVSIIALLVGMLLPAGYRVPSFAQVKFPTLKTHMLEHPWLQNTRQPCNNSFFGCEPYYFNHGFQSTPVTLFYDGSIRPMAVMEALSSDRRNERQSGHGLWSRDTPFAQDGYFIDDGYDFAETSYHILTVNGARGRDTVGHE